MRKLNPADQKLLKESQREWLRNRDIDFKLMSKILGEKEGTVWQVEEANARMETVRERVLELEQYLNAIEN